MNKRIFIGFILMVLTLVASATTLSAQEYSRERLRGNVRTINQGGLVPIDSAALLRAKAEAAARRDSLYYSFIDSIARNEHMLYNELPATSRDSIRSIVAQRVHRDSLILMHGDSVAVDAKHHSNLSFKTQSLSVVHRKNYSPKFVDFPRNSLHSKLHLIVILLFCNRFTVII